MWGTVLRSQGFSCVSVLRLEAIAADPHSVGGLWRHRIRKDRMRRNPCAARYAQLAPHGGAVDARPEGLDAAQSMRRPLRATCAARRRCCPARTSVCGRRTSVGGSSSSGAPPKKKPPHCGGLYLCRLARPEGFEPPTPKFVAWCSIQLSYGRVIELHSMPNELLAVKHFYQKNNWRKRRDSNPR